jgi:ribonuclease P protein component
MERLHESSDIASIFAEIKPQYLDIFQIYTRKSNTNITRFGIIISKKHIPLAVNRNTFKRQIRELFRKQIGTKTSHYDILVLVRTRPKQENKTQVLEQLTQYINTLT